MSNAEWRAGILAATTAELVERNGADFLAYLLQKAVQEQRDLIARHGTELRLWREANAGGLAVYWLAREAKRQGRKTLRVDDILGAMAAAGEEPACHDGEVTA